MAIRIHEGRECQMRPLEISHLAVAGRPPTSRSRDCRDRCPCRGRKGQRQNVIAWLDARSNGNGACAGARPAPVESAKPSGLSDSRRPEPGPRRQS
eukprot:1461054-Pyramimonas_sp.AAC.1